MLLYFKMRLFLSKLSYELYQHTCLKGVYDTLIIDYIDSVNELQFLPEFQHHSYKID